MTTDDKFAAILAAVQTDPGGRGLARDPADNLFTACPGDLAAACESLTRFRPPDRRGRVSAPCVVLCTGFYIPTGRPPAWETDGPLGVVFLSRALRRLGIDSSLAVEPDLERILLLGGADARYRDVTRAPPPPSHILWVERAGPAADGRCYSMRGRDLSSYHHTHNEFMAQKPPPPRVPAETIAVGDGGNEIGMGKVPHATVAKNIPNGDLVHCRVATDRLIVAGVSNWGAYAVAGGLFALRGERPPADLFDPDRERDILRTMVTQGPLVDGVTGDRTPTVDGLTWDEYAGPLVRIREILEA